MLRNVSLACALLLTTPALAQGTFAFAGPVGLDVPSVYEQDAANLRRRVLRTAEHDGGTLTPEHVRHFHIERAKLDRERPKRD